MNKLIIYGKLPGQNEIDKANRTHWSVGAKLKKSNMRTIMELISVQKIRKCHPMEIIFTWYEPNKRRDKDNISSGGRKLILDSLVKMNILDGDGWKGYGDFDDRFDIDSKNPRVEVELI